MFKHPGLVHVQLDGAAGVLMMPMFVLVVTFNEQAVLFGTTPCFVVRLSVPMTVPLDP